MRWKIHIDEEFENWLDSLSVKEFESVMATSLLLENEGPKLHRPTVGSISNSKFHNMKELRPLGTTIRILFIFDPNRNAVYLISGNKKDEWKSWYKRNIPLADEKYEIYLNNLTKKRGDL